MINFLVQAVVGSLGGEEPPKPTPKKTLTVDKAVLEKSINDALRTFDQFKYFAEKEMIKIMKLEMANVSARVARATPPLNGKGTAEAEKNIEDDINYIFRPLQEIPFGSLVLARYWEGVKAYNFKFKSKRLQTAYDSGNWEVIHKAFARGGMGDFEPYDEDFLMLTDNPSKNQQRAAMDNRGRLNGIRWHVTGERDSAQQKIDKHVKFMQQGIGKMVGGWIRCFQLLKGQGFSLPLQWATKGSGKVIVQETGPNKEVTIENSFGNYGGYADKRYAAFNYILHECADAGYRRYIFSCDTMAKKLNMK